MAFDVQRLPFGPPLEPMLAKRIDALPEGEGWLYEPKWDGFRAIVFREGESVYIQSRDRRPLDRYFPELREPLLAMLPDACVLDGELVVARGDRLDFDALQLRLHPAASRVKKLAAETPASFIAFDLLALGGEDLRERPQAERRELLTKALAQVSPPLYLTPMTTERAVASDWFQRFEGAGLDGVIAKSSELTYQPKKRAMFKIKHQRTAECIVGGFRWHKHGPGSLIGSLLLGLYDARGRLHHVGVTSSFSMERRRELLAELEPLREDAKCDHPWGDWAKHEGERRPGMQSRWSAGKDLSFELLRPERVCEVAYDHLQGNRFRHAATFLRWRFDKPPTDCRLDQLETTPPYELASIFGEGGT